MRGRAFVSLRVSRAELRNGSGHWRALRRRGLWRTPSGSGHWRPRALEAAFGEQAHILLFCFIFCYYATGQTAAGLMMQANRGSDPNQII